MNVGGPLVKQFSDIRAEVMAVATKEKIKFEKITITPALALEISRIFEYLLSVGPQTKSKLCLDLGLKSGYMFWNRLKSKEGNLFDIFFEIRRGKVDVNRDLIREFVAHRALFQKEEDYAMALFDKKLQDRSYVPIEGPSEKVEFSQFNAPDILWTIRHFFFEIDNDFFRDMNEREWDETDARERKGLKPLQKYEKERTKEARIKAMVKILSSFGVDDSRFMDRSNPSTVAWRMYIINEKDDNKLIEDIAHLLAPVITGDNIYEPYKSFVKLPVEERLDKIMSYLRSQSHHMVYWYTCTGWYDEESFSPDIIKREKEAWLGKSKKDYKHCVLLREVRKKISWTTGALNGFLDSYEEIIKNIKDEHDQNVYYLSELKFYENYIEEKKIPKERTLREYLEFSKKDGLEGSDAMHWAYMHLDDPERFARAERAKKRKLKTKPKK